jgi:hypothetical protein
MAGALISYMSITHRRYSHFLLFLTHQASIGGIARKRGDADDESKLTEHDDG